MALLLDAVNVVLLATGESEVTVLDNTHPQQASIIGVINKISKRAQRKRWWFNTFRRTLPYGTNLAQPTRVAVPPEVYEVQPVRRSLNYIKRDGYLFDKDSYAFVENMAVDAVTTEVLDYEDLPDTFGDWVAAKAALSFASSFAADPLKLQSLSKEVGDAQIPMMAEHIRESRVNLFQSGSAGVTLSRSYGLRYGRYS